MALYERKWTETDRGLDKDGRPTSIEVDRVERAFLPSGKPDRDAQIREWAATGLHGWEEVSDASDAEPAALSRPAKNAAKGAWVDWAVAQGADRGEAEKASKDDLIAAYGEKPSDPSGGGE